MGIQKIEMYTCVCDGCGVSTDEDTDYSCWSDSSIARDVAVNADWLIEDGKDYCPKCHSYDDEYNLILKNKKTMSNLKVGQKVRLIGYPGKIEDKYNPKYTDGIIISVTADLNPIIVEWQGNPKIRNSYIPKYLEIV